MDASWFEEEQAVWREDTHPMASRFNLPEPKPLRILIVEDQPLQRASLTLFLTKFGHWVESAPDSGSALERLRQGGFDVLLTDIWLPHSSGWNLLSELKLRGQLPPRVISMSGMYADEAQVQSRDAGCHAHLVKPFLHRELEAVLR